MPSDSPFALARAGVADMVEIFDVCYTCFAAPERRIFMGCYTIDDLPKIRQKYTDAMQNDTRVLWIKVVDKQTGKIIAASKWNLYLQAVKADEMEDMVPEWLEPEDLKVSRDLMTKWDELRAKSMPGPFLRVLLPFIVLDS